MAEQQLYERVENLNIGDANPPPLRHKRSQRLTVPIPPQPAPPLPFEDGSATNTNTNSNNNTATTGTSPSSAQQGQYPSPPSFNAAPGTNLQQLMNQQQPQEFVPSGFYPPPNNTTNTPGDNAHKQTNDDNNSNQSDEIIPVACVIKNIPFSLSRDELLAIINDLHIPAPYAFNYHYDPSGAFRGLAFANFHSASDTDTCVAALNGYDVQGRKLRVEYKKVLKQEDKERIEREKAIRRIKSAQLDKHRREPSYEGISDDGDFGAGFHSSSFLSATTGPGGHHDLHGNNVLGGGVPSSALSTSGRSAKNANNDIDLNDPHSLEIYSRLLLFKQDNMRDEFAFSRSLNPTQRRAVHLIAKKLGLAHHSVGQGDDRHVVVSKRRINDGKSLRHASSTLGRSLGNDDNNRKQLRNKKSMPDLRSISSSTKRSFNADAPPLPDMPVLSRSNLAAAAAAAASNPPSSMDSLQQQQQQTNMMGAFAPFGGNEDSKLYNSYYQRPNNTFGGGNNGGFTNPNAPAATVIRQPKGPDDQVEFVRRDTRGLEDPQQQQQQQQHQQNQPRGVEVQTGSALDF